MGPAADQVIDPSVAQRTDEMGLSILNLDSVQAGAPSANGEWSEQPCPQQA